MQDYYLLKWAGEMTKCPAVSWCLFLAHVVTVNFNCALPCEDHGLYRPPCGAQHPDDGGPGLHWHQLVCQPSLSGLPGRDALPPLEAVPVGLVCHGRGPLLYAPCCHGAVLCPAGTPGGDHKGAPTAGRLVCGGWEGPGDRMGMWMAQWVKRLSHNHRMSSIEVSLRKGTSLCSLDSAC